MKKLIALMMSMVMLVAFAACGNDTNNGGGDTQTDKAKLVMATNAEFPPYEYYEGGEIVGIDAEIAAAIADKLGMELQISDMAFDSILVAVQSGQADMGMAGMTVREDRLENADFSAPYATSHQVVIVKEGSDIATIDDLAGKKIGVQTNTTGDIFATEDFGD